MRELVACTFETLSHICKREFPRLPVALGEDRDNELAALASNLDDLFAQVPRIPHDVGHQFEMSWWT